MNENDARAMNDQHSRDEAQMRQLQQQAAGTGHSPLEAYPQHGAQSALTRPAATLVEDYERALARERAAWENAKSVLQESSFAAAWQAWRAAVEERDKATRLLINQSIAGS